MAEWAQLFKVQKTAVDRLQKIMTTVDDVGNAFDLSKLVKYEAERRRVLDALIPEHQKTARGPLFTDETCRTQLMRSNVDIEARSIACIAIELLQQFEDHVDWNLEPHYNDAGQREINQHIGSGDPEGIALRHRQRRLRYHASVPFRQDPVRIEGVAVANVRNRAKHRPACPWDAGDSPSPCLLPNSAWGLAHREKQAFGASAMAYDSGMGNGATDPPNAVWFLVPEEGRVSHPYLFAPWGFDCGFAGNCITSLHLPELSQWHAAVSVLHAVAAAFSFPDSFG